MRQTAQVIKVIAPGRVEVRIRRQSACAGAHRCGSCDACALMANAPEVVVTARDDGEHQPGDMVTVESPTSHVLGAAALVYLAPFALFLLGYLLGNSLGWSDGSAIALGGGGFLLGILGAIALDRRCKTRPVRYRVVSTEG